jgi:hypothetical protein
MRDSTCTFTRERSVYIWLRPAFDEGDCLFGYETSSGRGGYVTFDKDAQRLRAAVAQLDLPEYVARTFQDGTVLWLLDASADRAETLKTLGGCSLSFAYQGAGTCLTLRTRYSAAGSRFIAPATAGTPRRLCPSHKMFLAAFSSRSRIRPQVVQTCVRTLRLFSMRAPHPLQSCVVYAGQTASTRFPAHTALQARIERNCLQPAS